MIKTADQADRSTIGNKAASLAELADLGFRVPRTWVIPSEAYAAYARGEDPLATFDLGSWLRESGVARFAVRSSCNVEDSKDASFAGLFESYLDLRDETAVRAAIYKCWESCRTERVRRYAETKKIALDSVAMSVIVQEYVEADFAGVAFTVNPMTGSDREMLVEMCEGCGDKLVAGQVNPARYRLSWSESGKVLERSSPLAIVRPQDLLQLQQNLRSIQAAKGRPQDIEFAFSGGRMYVLQSRDITRIQIGEELGEWTTADLRDGGVSAGVVTPLMWSFYRMCIQESMSEYFAGLKLHDPARDVRFADVFYARPYWNLGYVKSIMTRVPGFKERNFDEDISVQPAYEGDGVVTPVTLKGIIGVIPTVIALKRSFGRQLAVNAKVLAHSREIEPFYRQIDVAALSDAALAKTFEHLCRVDYPLVEKNYFKTIYNTSNAKLELKVDLERIAKRDPDVRYNELMSGLDSLHVIQPIYRLWELCDYLNGSMPAGAAPVPAEEEPSARRHDLASLIEAYENPGRAAEPAWAFISALRALDPHFAEKLHAFIDEFYFHSEVELDITVPRWGENPDFVLRSLQTLLKGSAPARRPETVEAKKRAILGAAMLRAESALGRSWLGPLHRRSFHKNLSRLRHYAWMREEMRDRSTRMYSYLRRLALECGRRLQARGALERIDDVFYLEFDEILSALRGAWSAERAREAAAAAKLYADSYRQYKNPNEIGARWSHVPRPAVSNALQPKSAKTWRGIACSSGVVRGRARVVRSLKDAGKLQSGDILIAPFTDPGWTPLFSVVAGVVTETGGLLSHAALISREYAMPAVLNVPGLTEILEDGQEIIVDGRDGLVHLVEPGARAGV
ncbi:MAG TPA: PEP/pyruvate-binding domain-containing protein [Bdellovibrionales bacterium]|nr:PEP/pyruvate-binding domain-containing protein [Bdellovibrionales bacterium]